MLERREFRLSNDDLERLHEAAQPVRMMALNCGVPSSPLERSDRVWQSLGMKYGFVWDTVAPIEGKGLETFTAEVKVDA
jgi:hypothetical protein